MVALLYCLNVLVSAGQSTLSKIYARSGGEAHNFNVNKALAGLLCFLILGLFFGLSFHLPTILLGSLYGLFLCLSMYAGFRALALGPMALSSIIASFSLVIPMLFGLIIWKEKLSVFGLIGIPLLLAAIFLIGFKKEGNTSFRWLLFALLTLAANGICSLIQKGHQRIYPKEFRFEFMISALSIVLLLLIILSFRKRKMYRFTFTGVIAGVLNGMSNYIVLMLAALVNASILFPMISITTIVAVWLIGTVLFKEKLKPMQILGLFLGLISMLMLNL